MKIGFIGQGWIGKNYADDFEERGYEVVRYALEEPYKQNKGKLQDCDIIFIAVPTPTTQDGFDDSIVRSAIKSAPDGATIVIKSTLAPGSTESIQKEHPKKFVLHSPEFLTVRHAKHDAKHPNRNIVGIPVKNAEYTKKAEAVLEVLPDAPYETVCAAVEAELIKHGGNNWFYFKVVFINMLYDLVSAYGGDWEVIKEAMAADPRIGSSHLDPKHTNRDIPKTLERLIYRDFHLEPKTQNGRGAGGECFIKDFESFIRMYKEMVGDDLGINALESVREKNLDLLIGSGKDLDLLEGVYGDLSKRKLKYLHEIAHSHTKSRSK